MIVKIKSYFLKDGIDPSVLKKYGYEKCGENYDKELVEFGLKRAPQSWQYMEIEV